MSKSPAAGASAGQSGPDWAGVLRQMVQQASALAGGNWESCQRYAEPEFRKLAITGESILEGIKSGEFSVLQAQVLLDAQRHSSQNIIAHVHLMKPQLRISLDVLTYWRDGRLARPEGVGDEAGQDMDHGVHHRPVA
jgi:hypothetical protein